MNKYSFWLKGQLAFKVGVVALVLAGSKFVVGYTGLELFSANPFLPSLLAGTVVLLGFLLAGVLADFKEAEKMPTEVATALRNIYDEGLYVKEFKEAFNLEGLKVTICRVLTSFLDEIHNGIGVDRSLRALSELNEPLLQMDTLYFSVVDNIRYKAYVGNF